ncbi:nucleic acid dioxygenase ALKBH1 isoform X2 [Plodia interpunctella]|uniref:nucleic acid dioxygenase ALKBH1 isoform X2 n=1 Tax=Plodia interpunctella TaxID=58824 RepID=UPI002367EB3B|nr:nucleic acid dioxygenase ALKBH1 isoform X2 [Plodia interpunctella]
MARVPPPPLSKVIDVDNAAFADKITKLTFDNNVEQDDRLELLGLKPFAHWPVFTIKKHPGLIFIRNPFTSHGQRYWIRKCLEKYPRKPNKTNIDIEVILEDWWETCYEGHKCNIQLLKKLRWTTLGYHHNWDTKEYSEANRNNFPSELSELCDVVATYLGYNAFRAEAAIVNYYHMNSTLSAHTDHSEINLEAPLFSFSFGQSAIFLIGGEDKSTVPSAVLLQSGDILVMSKEARLCYHAVPKILSSPSSPWNDNVEDIHTKDVPKFRYIYEKDVIVDMNSNQNNGNWSIFNGYVQESRINVNIRQVLNETQSRL